MRMRKKPWARDYINTRFDVLVNEPSLMKGKWHEILKCDELHLEIGCGKGDYWINMAKMYPDIGWIAIELSVDAAAVAIRKTEGNVLENMKIIIGSADNLDEWFEMGEIDTIHLNFSDPWPKKGHTKRRLTYKSYLEKYLNILAKDGQIIMKTDNSGLFEYSLLSLEENGFRLVDVSVDFRRNVHDEDAITEYEHNFMSVNQPIYRAIWNRR